MVVVCFYLHPKEQPMTENKIKQRSQIGKGQLNDISHNLHKDIVRGHRNGKA